MAFLSPKKLFLLFSVIIPFFLTAFSPELQSGQANTQPRPALSGPVLTYDAGQFLIHYTLTGEDAVDPADLDGSGQPDYIEAVAEAVNYAWQQQVERLGWHPPLPDQGEGGDTRFDVYIENQNGFLVFEDVFGYVETVGGLLGDTPSTDLTETNAAYGYLSLDNDYNFGQSEYELSPLDSMRTTAAHELHHAIQAAYDDTDPYEWLYEASAVWMEDELFPEIGGARNYLVDYMAAPDLCPLSIGRDSQDVRWYGDWILLRYISEHYGGPDTIRQLWEQMSQLDGLAALQVTLTEHGTNLADVLVNFAVANLVKSNCPANAPYCYEFGQEYLRPYVESSVRVRAGETIIHMPKDGVQQFGADYLRLKSDEPIRLDFQGSTAGQWRLQFVGLRGLEVQVLPWTEPVSHPINPADFDKLYLVIVNTAQVERESDCGYHNYTLAIGPASANIAGQAPPPAADPGPYLPPGLVSVRTDDEATSPDTFPSGRPITAAEAPFAPLYPGYLPGGYSFEQLSRYTTADLGDWVEDYAPGGQPVISLDYGSSDPDSYLSIVQSLARAQTIYSWVNRLGYAKADIRLIKNQPVYLIDLSDEIGPASSATFVHQGRFIVIDGTITISEMQRVVTGFLTHNP